ncbi:MAG: DMT family transporter [Alphaproteobacteria bacterium]|nr:DMT family transporter [Alphaproteobacteria bacterium]
MTIAPQAADPGDAATASRTRATRALPALLLGAMCIGLSGIFVKLSEVGPQANAFFRIAGAAPFYWAFLALVPGSRTRARIDPRQWRLLLLASLVVVGDYACWHVSLKLTSVANSTLLANLVPIFVALHAALFLGKSPRRLFLLAMAITLSGAALLLGGSLSLSADRALGDGLGVVTAMFYAAYVVIVAELRTRMTTATLMAWTGTIAGPLFLPLAFLFDELILPRSLEGWTTVLALILVCQVAGSGLIAYALAHMPTTFSSLTLLAQPVFSALAAWAILGERLGTGELLGGALVLAGIYLARRAS